MTLAAVRPLLPEPLVAQMRGLAGAGFNLIPLGGGNDGKSPLCPFAEKAPRLSQVLGLMRAYHSTAYGIRLDGLLVVDADEVTPETEDLVGRRFGSSTVQVATPRGRHFWYRHDGGPVPNLRGEGLPVDIKHESRAYVVGPGSVRHDGGEYVPIQGVLGQTALPTFPSTIPRPNRSSGPVAVGTRNKFLCKQACSYAPLVLTKGELLENLLHDRDTLCEIGGEPMPDAEIIKIADWGWNLRAEGKLFEGRNSQVRVTRANMDALLSCPSGEAAFALHTLLDAAHGHIPGKRFGLNFEGMKQSRLITFGRDRFRAAVALLLELGLLRKVGGYVPGRQSQQYQLGRLTPVSVVDLPLDISRAGGEVL